MAYCGDLRGAVWNVQALFARKASKQEKKWNKVLELMERRDFVLVSETHSTAGKALAEKQCLKKLGFRAYWSHGGPPSASRSVHRD